MIQHYNQALIDDAGDGYTVISWGYKRGDGKDSENFIKEERAFSAYAGAPYIEKRCLIRLVILMRTFCVYGRCRYQLSC